jgi:hypothetical protein
VFKLGNTPPYTHVRQYVKGKNMNRLKIDLGRDGDPNGTPPSAWIIWDGETFRMEVECYKEAWCELGKENAEIFFNALGIKDNADIERVLRSRFTQSSTLQNFQLLDELMSICEKNNIKYAYNSWCSIDR